VGVNEKKMKLLLDNLDDLMELLGRARRGELLVLNQSLTAEQKEELRRAGVIK